MAGEFLPPVVTTLDGEIQPLLDKLAEAKAAIKALGDTKVSIPINVELNKSSVTRAMSDLKAATSGGIDVTIRAQPDAASLAGSLAGMQAVARANPITVPIKTDTRYFPGLGTQGHYWATQDFMNRLPFGYGGPAGGGFGSPYTPTFWDRHSQPNPNFLGGPIGAWLAGAGGRGGGNQAGWGAYWAGGLWNSLLGRNGAWPYAMTHMGLLGLGALGAGALGLGVGAGTLGAVYGTTAGAVGRQASNLYTSTLSVIPPGVPDYVLARTFGLTNAGPNSPLAMASVAGQGQVYSALGGILALANKGGPLASIIANNGTMLGTNLTNYIARKDLAAGISGSAWQRFIGNTTGDATNLLAGFGGIGRALGYTIGSMPGEIEWLTTGFRDLGVGLGGLTKLPVLGQPFHIPGVNGTNGKMPGLLHDLLFSAMLMHGGQTIANLAGGGLGDSFLTKLPVIGNLISKIPGLGLLGDGGYMGMLNPVSLGITAALASGLYLYREQSPGSAAIKALNGNFFGQGFGSALSNTFYDQRLFANGTRTGSNGISFLGKVLGATQYQDWVNGDRSPLAAFGWLANQVVPGGLGKRISLSDQNAVAFYNMQQALISGPNSVGGEVNSIASAFGLSTAQAAQYAAAAGVKQGDSPAMARRLVRSYMQAAGIFNPRAGAGTPLQMFNAANMGVTGVVGDSAWKAAGQVNSNWDAFMGALTGGGIGLGNLASVMAKVNPSVAHNLAATGSLGTFISTSQGIQSAGQPMLDFFRQAQATGAISTHSLQQSFLQVAASMGPLAGHSKAAQAELLALANESGLNVKSFGQLMRVEGGAGKASGNLAHSVEATVIAMSKVPEAMKQVAQSILVGTNGAIAAAVEKSGKLTDKYNALTTVLEHNAPASKKAANAAGILADGLVKAKVPVQEVKTFLGELGINLNKIPAYVRKELHIVTNAKQAAHDLWLAGGAWANIPNGQVKRDEVIVSQQTTLKYGHTALGVRDRVMGGWSWVGENGPELMYQPSGTTVIPAHRTGQTVAAAMSAMGGGGHGDVHIYLDGKEIFGVVKTRTWDYNTVNGNRTRGGRMAGTMRPRP